MTLWEEEEERKCEKRAESSRGIFWLTGKKGGNIWEGSWFLEISVTVGFTGCVHVLLQPFPHVFLMYINSNSRGQCALGGSQTPLLLINSIQSSFLSLWSTLGS